MVIACICICMYRHTVCVDVYYSYDRCPVCLQYMLS